MECTATTDAPTVSFCQRGGGRLETTMCYPPSLFRYTLKSTFLPRLSLIKPNSVHNSPESIVIPSAVHSVAVLNIRKLPVNTSSVRVV